MMHYFLIELNRHDVLYYMIILQYNMLVTRHIRVNDPSSNY